MTKIIAGMTMSLDGYIQDARGSIDALFPDLEEWREQARGKASIASTGAVLMGRKTFEMAGDPDGYADAYEYQVPIFVVGNHPPAEHPRENGKLSFTFVRDGVGSAVAQAKAAAANRNVTVVGGPTLIHALLRERVVDELDVDIMPVLLHGGMRLFDGLGAHELTLERIGVDTMEYGRTALRFAVRRS